jgi:hypothetical protein
VAVQWAHLGRGRVLVASSRQAWIHRPQLGALGDVGPMGDFLPASVATTRRLLDGAIAAAEQAAAHRTAPWRPQPLSAERWAWLLVNQWYCAHHSVALLGEVVSRYEAIDRPDLVRFARRKLIEERGHDEFALRDLAALGYDGERLVRNVSPAPEVGRALEYASRCVRGGQPVKFVGYVYTLERRILQIPDALLVAIEDVLPAGVNATSFVRMHTSGLDAEHVDDAVTFIAGLPAADRTEIAIACHAVTRICATHAGRYPSDAELAERLVVYRQPPARSGAGRSARKDRRHEPCS